MNRLRHTSITFRGFFSRRNILIFALALLFLAPYFLIAINPPYLSLNQHYIEKLDSEYRASGFQDKISSFISYNSYVWNNAFNRRSPEGVNLRDPDEVFDYVFSQIPFYSIVYPTEMYYYYKFNHGNSTISGNIRLVELINGNLTAGYFSEAESVLGAKKFGSAEGVGIKKISENLFRVSYKDKNVYFRLSDIWDDPPEKLAFDSEEFVAKVRDESGVIFYLMFDNDTKAFYYVLDEVRALTEELSFIHEDLVIGDRTGFAYYNDAENGRKVLIAVKLSNVASNNYLDGPFDQVPPRLDILDKLHEGYPYTKAMKLDTYGNFLFSDSMRMAITPYMKYYNTVELSELISACKGKGLEGPSLYYCLTWEEKRDFHKNSDMFYEDGTLKNESIRVG